MGGAREACPYNGLGDGDLGLGRGFFAAAGDFVGEEVFGHQGVWEDGFGFEEEVFPFGASVAGGVARAEVGHNELPDAREMSRLGGHGGGGVLAGKGHFGFGVGKGGFMD